MLNEPIVYDFFAPPRIVFGWGRRREVSEIARTLGRRAVLVWGSKTLRASGMAAEIVAALKAAELDPFELTTISHEPLVADVDATTQRLLELGPVDDVVIVAIGGGSAIDLAKAVAAMATNAEPGTSVREFLESVGTGKKITRPPLPVLAMPTTSGTGSEATKNAVISSLDPPFKKSLRSDLMLPRAVLVDPELTVSCPPTVTAYSGMDAITQCLESYISRKAKPIASALAEQGWRLASRAIVTAVEDPTCRWAREAMSHAALLSGMALANSGLGMAHGVAAALGVHCSIPHGLACAVMLPVTLRTNLDSSTSQLAQLEWTIGGPPNMCDSDSADALIDRVQTLCDRVNIPRSLGELGVRREQIPSIVAGSRGNSMDGNPRQLSDVELTQILESLL